MGEDFNSVPFPEMNQRTVADDRKRKVFPLRILLFAFNLVGISAAYSVQRAGWVFLPNVLPCASIFFNCAKVLMIHICICKYI